MEDIIIYVIVAVAVVVNIIRTYQKEQEKHKKRDNTQSRKPVIQRTTPVIQPLSERQSETVAERSRRTIANSNIHSTIDYPSLENSYLNSEEEMYLNRDSGLSFSDDRSEKPKENKADKTNTTFELKLDTPEEVRRAFIHSLIFYRKY